MRRVILSKHSACLFISISNASFLILVVPPKCSVYDSSIVHLGVQVNAFFVFQWHVEESFFLVERAHLPHFVIGQCEVENPDVLFYVVVG